jgi:hypothetical protein
MTVYLCNSFTLSMIAPSLLEGGAIIKASPISLGEVKALLKEGFISAVGHESTAKVLSSLLGTHVPFNRAQIAITGGDIIISFQFLIRLPEGKVLGEDEVLALYNEGKIKFFRVEVILPTEEERGLLALYDLPADLYIWQEGECDLCGEATKVVFFHKGKEWNERGVNHLAICRKCVEAIITSPLSRRLNYVLCNCGG